MRLIQNMCTIAEYPTPGSAAADYCLGAAGRRLVKISVVGASGVGKTGESKRGSRLVVGRDVGMGRGRPPDEMETGEVGVAAESSAPSCPCFNLRGLLGVTLARRLSG